MPIKPQVFKKSGTARSIRMAKSSTAREAIGEIEKGSDTYILTFGQFSLIDAMIVILDQTGPADVSISTWTAADAHLARSAELLESATIRSLRFIVDRSFESRQPEYCHHMRTLFGEDCIRAIRTHAKFMLIRSNQMDIVVRTSMNLNENPRLENIEISESAPFALFFQTIIDAIFDEVDEKVNRSVMLDLGNIPDTYPFREISARQIPRSSLNEARAEFTLKKL